MLNSRKQPIWMVVRINRQNCRIDGIAFVASWYHVSSRDNAHVDKYVVGIESLHGSTGRKFILQRLWGKFKRLGRKKLKEHSGLDELDNHFSILYKLTNAVKLRNFQYRLLNNKNFCNDIPVHWGKTDKNICDICLTKKQSTTHLLFNCCRVRPIWMLLQVKLRDNRMWI